MEEAIIQYYYNRWSEYPTKVYCPPWETQGPENRLSWHKCSFERGLKRFRVSCQQDFFYHYVVLVTGNETAITVREAFADRVGPSEQSRVGGEWHSFVMITLNKKGIFGDDNKDSTSLALRLFSHAMNTCIDESMAC